MKTKLPKQYLSYSAIDLWYKNKPEFRKRYYEGKKPIETRYTIYGKTAHESIDKDPELAHIPRLETKEHDIRVNIGDVPIRGFIDTFNPNTNQFYEYKTGLKMADGGSRWTVDKVSNHRQLPFYSLLIREKYGSYNPNTLLILLETDWVKDSIKHGGVEVIISEELKLTGRCEMFMRKITDKELDETKDWLLKAAEEIVTDFDWWKHVNGKRSLTS